MMPIYPYRCRDCDISLELQYPMGSAPNQMECPYCGGTLQQDYQAKRVQFMGIKACHQEENQLTEADQPTPEALQALHAFAERIQPARRESGHVYEDFQFGSD